ncbi:MAG TPA: hypothetical protein VFE90_12230 [Myxococcales bacterium]|nr:hypothetical protein [Myxococcales bacterium]
MSFGKMVVLLLGLAAASFAVRTALRDTVGRSSEHTAPRRQLDNVRERAKELEREQQNAVDEVARKAESN